MPILTLKFKDSNIGEYHIKEGQSLTIGRLDKNNIVIENLAVSGRHAKIDALEDGYLLTDLKSKNGSFVNEKQVTSHWLENNDVITIGKHTLIFAYKEGEKQFESAASGSMDETMVMDTSDQKDLLAKSVPDMAAMEKKEPIGILSFLSGGEGEIELTKKLIKIGKDSSSDIKVGGLMVGKTAATISKRPQGYHLSYVEGMSKPKVNNEAVKESVLLKEFDIIEIGSIKMEFILK
jgi:pSer/pThr/pTyr-binding forkhead associated (FHA) protein